MDQQTFESLLPKLQVGLPLPAARPGLLYDGDDLARLRARAETEPDIVRPVIDKARTLLEAGDVTMAPEPYYALGKLNTLISAHMLRPEREFEDFILALLDTTADAPTWICHVHPGMRCDHCAPNTASAVAMAVDALGAALPAETERRLTLRAAELCLTPFLQCCRDRSEFWARREHRFNWRIMTCGEAGLAALGLDVPDREDIVAYALEGVCDILDRVPPEGDWEEGPGYWAGTLLHGLRFALALKRITDGRVDLFAHPALRATADYFTCTTLPGGSVFNYADNGPRISPTPLHLLARQLRLGALARTARRMGFRDAWDLLLDDPDLPGEEPGPELKTRVFPTTGIGVTRSDWSDDATFVGLKSGPTSVGHSHLDIQSVVLSKGGTPLLIDPGIWPYGSKIGFFDSSPGGRRWDFDANATVAHNTVLVDGQGQSCATEYEGRIIAWGADQDLSWFVSDGAAAYPGLLTRFRRTIVLAGTDVALIYDDLASDRPRHWEWLAHVAGQLAGGPSVHVLENDDIRLSLVRLLPPADTPWRNSQQTRTSYYEDSDALAWVEKTIDVHRFGPMLPSQQIEFLWVLDLDDDGKSEWAVERDGDNALIVKGCVSVRIDAAEPRCSLA